MVTISVLQERTLEKDFSHILVCILHVGNIVIICSLQTAAYVYAKTPKLFSMNIMVSY